MGALKLTYYERERALEKSLFFVVGGVEKSVLEEKKGIDYYSFGSILPGRSFNSGNYGYGFQGQEEDQETGLVNYKYRMHDPRLGRFLSIDPLAPSYPHNSPYAFSENRVIDGVELEGLEFSKVEGTGDDGRPVLTIKLDVEILIETQDPILQNIYQHAIKEAFSDVIGGVQGEGKKYNGEVNFVEGASIKLVIGGVKTQDNLISGMSFIGGVFLNMNEENTDGSISRIPIEQIANDAVHEFLHQGGVRHPTENDAASDVKLNQLGPLRNTYESTATTTNNIIENIML